MLQLKNVHKYFYRRKSNEIHVINDTSLEFGEKGLVALLGPSGCGKTTLLNVIGGLDRVNRGQVFLNRQRITGRTAWKVDKIRNLNIGYIFQNYNLIDNMTVYDNVAMVLRMVGIKDKEEIREKVEYALDLVGMYRYRKRFADMLSGGERQRVGIARAIVKNPSIIIADEPTGNLDSANTLEVMNIIKAISREKLVILVTHEENLANFYADRIIRLRDGVVVSDEPNENESGLDYRIENRIYLRDIKDQRHFGDGDYDIHVYNDSGQKMALDIVISKGNLFIQTRDERSRVEVVDEDSSIELIDDHYRALTAEEAEAHRFNPARLATSRTLKHSSILNFFTMLVSGFRTVAGYHTIKKILLLGFVISAMFITYSVSNIVGIWSIKDSAFVEDDVSYLRILEKNVSVEDFLAYEEDPNVEYALPGKGKINMTMPYDEYWQTSWSQTTFSGSLSSSADLTEEDIKYGRLPENSQEIVVDALILKRIQDQGFSDITDAGYKTADELVGRHLTLPNLPQFTIVGVTDKESPCIYADPSQFINMLDNNGSNDEMGFYEEEMGGMEGMESSEGALLDVALKKDELKIKKGRWPDNDYEVIVSNTHAEEMPLNKEIKQKVNGQKLKVVGYYTSDTVGDNYFVNSNTIKYKTILANDNVTVKPVDKEAAKASLEEMYGVKVRDLYKYERKEYRSSQLGLMRAFILVGGIIILISLVEIFLIMRASFLSRIKEVGTLRAIGVKKSDIYRMFAGEIIAITVYASIPGWAFMNYIVYKLQGVSYFATMFLCNYQTMIASLLVIFLFNLLFGLMPVFHTLIKKPAAILARTEVN